MIQLKQPFFFLLIFLLAGRIGFSQDKWDLRRCVEYALANNVSVKQADVQARLAKLTLNQSKLNQYPTASISGSFGVNGGRSIDPTTNLFTNQQLLFSGLNFNTGMTLFNWMNIRNTIAGNKLEVEASNAFVEKIKNDISLNIATSYLLVLTSNEQVKIAQVAIQQSLQNLDITRKRVDAGSLPELNSIEIEAQLARDSATYINAKATLEQSILQLKAFMNLDASTPFEVAMPPLETIPIESLGELQPEYVYREAIINFPQQKFNDLKLKAAQKFSDAAKGALYPSISLFGGLSSSYSSIKVPSISVAPTNTFVTTQSKVNVGGTEYFVQEPVYKTTITTSRIPYGTQIGDNFRQNVGISLNIPLFNNGLSRTNWERTKLNQKNFELTKELDNQTLKQDVYKAYNNALNSLQKYNASKKTLQASEKAYEFSKKRYDIGLLPSLDFLTNQNNLNRAKLELLSNQLDYVFRMKLLEFYKGKGIKLEK